MNESARVPFVAWSGWPHIRYSFLLLLFVTAWFGLVFAGADWFTAHRITRVRIDFGFESDIPLIPVFTLAYMSIYLLFLAVPFVLRARREVTALATAQSLTILVAGICFFLIPAKLAFAPVDDSELGIWKSLFRFADRLNLDYNLVPSLHVALSIVCIEWFCIYASRSVKICFRLWGVAIAASTLFTHQHHLVDVAAGYILAWGMVRFMKRGRVPANEAPSIVVPREASTFS